MHKSVIKPEVHQRDILGPAQRARDALFVGAIMAVGEAASTSYPPEQITEWVGNNPTPESLAEDIAVRLAYAVNRDWNVALELLKLHHKNLGANKSVGAVLEAMEDAPRIIVPS
jgi:hypothetical protein